MSEQAKRDAKAGFDALGALASAAASAPVEASPELRARLLASRARPGRYGVFADRIARLFDLTLERATELLRALEKPESWRPFLVEGTAIVPVETGPKCAGAIATFISVKPGIEFPRHVHRGLETTLVVDGGFVEPATKNETWRGEEIVRSEGSEHSLVGLPGIPCVAAVLITGHADFQ